MPVQWARPGGSEYSEAEILIKAHQMDSLWGWERFFEELATFMRELHRQAGSANESYCEYAVDRLEVCIQSLSSLIDHLRTRPSHVTESQASVAAQYSVQLTELLQCIRGLYIEWQGYSDGGTRPSTAYSAPLFQAHQVVEEGPSSRLHMNKSITSAQCVFRGYRLPGY